ncbi:FAD binding domain-containing protein [Iningainema tapete]|uniref:Xanthine dehydrogenase family protein subunit M n=1 Tax=Iningainema tapete BLCC-T55 TaxID=2748662 RepID=A0A8J7C5B1_9CYAN|nr:xanthine dehydrogenase family protein subunit M [Iningainema tapete]MBD2772874.1 xanthine dehydrogenase family protein subunit M [Iningainema tapete BLCC-T55]
MKNFVYQKAESVDAALNLIGQNAGAKFLGGGTNLVDLMRENIEQLDALVDVTHLSNTIEETADGAIRIGAAVKNTALANHELIREKFPFLSQAILFGASGQIRNMATVGGNLLQRTRCYYFYDDTAQCNKRENGAGCDAIKGFNRIHAILGTSDACIATHPSDMCVALAALDARVLVEGTNGKREIAFNDFHRLPENTPHIETDLRDGELITAVEIPRNDFAKNSLYQKVRDRASYAFALVSVAAALEIENNEIKNVRIALGGVAHKPWRALAAEGLLQGTSATEENFRRGAEAELENARGFAHNNFKIELAKRIIVSVLKELAEQGGTNR